MYQITIVVLIVPR